jgi:hypothetical protein
MIQAGSQSRPTRLMEKKSTRQPKPATTRPPRRVASAGPTWLPTSMSELQMPRLFSGNVEAMIFP